MSICVVGDLHGNINDLINVYDHIVKKVPETTAIIQVGDFGFYPDIILRLKDFKPEIPIYAIDGNHEDFRYLDGIDMVMEMSPNIFYVPRGTVMTLDNKKIAFLGGAASVDKMLRLRHGHSWYEQEQITDEQFAKLDGVDKVDLFITHTPPTSVIDKHFNPEDLRQFGLDPHTWSDPSALKVEVAWKRMGMPTLICGHMHRSVVEGTCRILNIAEVIAIP